jgi:hypothetical protein
MRTKSLLLTLAITILSVAASTVSAQTTNNTFVVTPNSPNGWYFYDDTTDSTATATGTFVDGPATPPLGTGSVNLKTPGATDRQGIATDTYAGTPLSSITTWGYSTYQPGPTLAITLQFDVRYRPTDTAYGGRLVFEPYQQTGTVGSGWQTWNPYNGVWWASKTTAAGSGGVCGQGNPCTWAQIKSYFPNAIINGRLILRAGGGWTNFDGNVDALTIGVTDGTATQVDTYDFNLHSTPATADECKNGGYKIFNPSFKNQGQCIQYVNTGK